MMALFFRKIGQPPVMGEVLGGILLGPSVFGFLFPETAAYLFNAEVLALLKNIADFGICLYLFFVGLEVDLPKIQKTARSAFLISQLSIIIPFALGLLLAWQIFAMYAPLGPSIFEFSLFLGVAFSITAFPVLARILSDSSLHNTKLGDLALICAAIGDITAWCLVAVVNGMSGTSNGAWTTIGFTLIYILFMFLLVQPLIVRIFPLLEEKFERRPNVLLAIAILGALGSAALTESIGIHALFGAFLFGFHF